MSHEPENVNGIPPPVGQRDPLADALARLEPAPARLDRDRLMYAAGAASRRTTIRLWQATAGFLAAIGFAAGMAARQPSIVYIDREPKPAKAAQQPVVPIPAPSTRQ
jgi:hypothetical protein